MLCEVVLLLWAETYGWFRASLPFDVRVYLANCVGFLLVTMYACSYFCSVHCTRCLYTVWPPASLTLIIKLVKQNYSSTIFCVFFVLVRSSLIKELSGGKSTNSHLRKWASASPSYKSSSFAFKRSHQTAWNRIFRLSFAWINMASQHAQWTKMEALDSEGIWATCEAAPPNDDGNRYVSFTGWSRRHDRLAKSKEVRPITVRDVEVNNLSFSSFRL